MGTGASREDVLDLTISIRLVGYRRSGYPYPAERLQSGVVAGRRDWGVPVGLAPPGRGTNGSRCRTFQGTGKDGRRDQAGCYPVAGRRPGHGAIRLWLRGVCEYCLAGDAQVCPHQTQPGFTGPVPLRRASGHQAADVNLVPLRIRSASYRPPWAAGSRRPSGLSRCTAVSATVTAGRARCGGVGLSAVMIASALGARVVAVDVAGVALDRAATSARSPSLTRPGTLIRRPPSGRSPGRSAGLDRRARHARHRGKLGARPAGDAARSGRAAWSANRSLADGGSVPGPEQIVPGGEHGRAVGEHRPGQRVTVRADDDRSADPGHAAFGTAAVGHRGVDAVDPRVGLHLDRLREAALLRRLQLLPVGASSPAPRSGPRRPGPRTAGRPAGPTPEIRGRSRSSGQPARTAA